jgi:hypothetical protein
VSVTGDPVQTGTWTENARVSLIDPSGTSTILKDFGVADGNPYNVLSYYTGPGAYGLRLEENGGGTATLTGGSVTVGRAECTGASCTLPPETAPGTTLGTALNWTGKETLTWPTNPSAQTYTLYRGTGADLPSLLSASTDSCTRYAGADTSTAGLAGDPEGVPGRFYWYLVTGSDGAVEGSAGDATAGARIVNSSGACP